MAESCRSIRGFLPDLNVRYWLRADIRPGRVSAFRPKAVIRLELAPTTSTDPKQTLTKSSVNAFFGAALFHGDDMNDELWGAIDVSEWRSLPVTESRCATEEDVATGRAVFHVPLGDEYEPSTPVDIGVPRPAVLTTSALPVFVVQAEEVNGKIAIGYRPVTGGNGLCLLDELELLDVPDDRFT